MLLETLTSPEVKELPLDRLIVIAPLGSFEQHGPHLPLTTDTDIVTAIARAVERDLPETVLCLPTLWLGHSTHHMHFPGTLDVPQMHYISVIEDLSRGCVELDTISFHSSWSTALAYDNPTTRPLRLTDGSYSSYRFRCTGIQGTSMHCSVLRPLASSR